MSDLDLGMNYWMTPAFEYPDQPMDRGKVLWEEDLEKMLQERAGDWGRYLDIDGDGIPYRTVAGNRHPRSAYFARGTGHDEYARYSEEPEVWERVLNRIARKFETARNRLIKPIIQSRKGARIGILSMGSTDPAIIEALDCLETEHQLPADYLRVRSIPFSDEVYDFIRNHDRIYVVEMNRDGQLHQILRLNIPECTSKLISVAHIDGMPLTAKWICGEITAQEAK